MTGHLNPIVLGGECMAEIARYSKAYVAEQFRKYRGWHEKAPPAKISMTQVGAEGGEALEYFFLHDNYVVTSDIFPDRYIAFDSVTDDWKRFCHEVLLFNPNGFES
jgi:hypothetical protein